MCGIFALFNGTLDPELIKLQFMKGINRGPEYSFFNKINNGYIGFHRLAINGLNENAHQPFNIDGCTLICNGEIYNYHALYDILFPLVPTTESDCEVIIHLYRKFGIEYTLHLLDGVFSFVLIDNREGKMFVARDPYGVRPLFYLKSMHDFGFASELKQLSYIYSHIKLHYDICSLETFQPGTLLTFTGGEGEGGGGWNHCREIQYSTTGFLSLYPNISQYEMVLSLIKTKFMESVSKRIVGTTDRPIACLLSGGLDSSLVASIVKRHVPDLETFSIGLKGSEDLKYAQKVADYLGTKHTSIVVSEEDFFDAIPRVIRAIESYDTTTVRASVGNYLVAEYIAKHSEAKVIFNGDGSDELMGGYLYFGAAPNKYEFDAECRRLLNDIHYFDVLRSDRCIASHGLEARTPFLDRGWVQFYLSIDPALRYHAGQDKCEKYLIREAFNDGTYLPDEILFRKKEAFSDGVSSLQRSWYEIIDEKVVAALASQSITNDWESLLKEYQFVHNPPNTKEQLYYRALFDIYYPNCGEIIPYYWMPRFVDAKDASARTLPLYTN